MDKTYQCHSCGYIWSLLVVTLGEARKKKECPKCFSNKTSPCNDSYYRKDYIEDDSFVYDDDYGGKM